MVKYLSFILATTILISCHNKTSPEQPGTIPITNIEKKVTFFPVTAFLKGQMLLLDSIQLAPMRINTIHDQSDSTWMKREELRPALKDFISSEINEFNLTPFFKETSFIDQTLNALTFTYSPYQRLPDSISLRHWDVYVNPETGKVTKVYIVKQVTDKGEKHTLQLIWQTNKWAKITTIWNKSNGGDSLLKADKIIWNFE